MTNHDVFEAFVDGREAAVGNVRSVRAGNGDVALFSYQTPIALRSAGAIVVDDRRYSVTTAKQVSGTVMPAHRAGMSWERIDHDVFRGMCAAAGVDLRYAR